MSFFGSKNFFFEVSKGNVSKHSTDGIVGINPAVSSKFEDIWDAGGIMSLATSAENWEIFSDNIADNIAGSGARTILVRSLDGNYVRQAQTVNLSGVTPVTLTGTHLRPRLMLVTAAGSGNVNQGKITLRSVTANETRLQMVQFNSTSFSSHTTVPSGQTYFTTSIDVFIPKNEDVTVKAITKSSATDSAFISTGELQVYQNSSIISIESPSPISEKTDLKFQAKSTNAAVSVTILASFLVVDND